MPRSTTARSRGLLIALGLALGIALAGCAGPDPDPSIVIQPTCGGLELAIDGALTCDQVAQIAVDTLTERSPDQIRRGVTAIDVQLAPCPQMEVPPQIDCAGEELAQMVKVTFGPPPANGPIEEFLVVAVAPVSGEVLGIANPLVR